MVDFAITNFYEASKIKRVPKLPTIWDELKDFWNYEVEHKGGVLNVFLMKTEEGRVHFGALFLVYVMPVGTVYVFYLLKIDEPIKLKRLTSFHLVTISQNSLTKI